MDNILESCGASVCEACGEEFTCGASLAGCWCTELKLTDEAQAALREKYQQCLCRPCLEKYATAESTPFV
ncbi:MAG: cysteine-rich CWC family protein [Pyrinomonadaceae bacterium]